MKKFASVLTILILAPAVSWGDLSVLRDQLMSSDPNTVEAAAREAAALTPKERKMLVMSLLIPLHRGPESAQAAAHGLSYLGKDAAQAIPDLVSALRFDDPAVAQSVGLALLKIGPESIPPLIKLLNDGNFIVRQRAAAVLGAFGPAAGKAAPDLVDMLQDSQTEAAAESALLKIGEAAVPALASALKKAHPNSKQTIIRLLGQFHSPASTTALLQTLKKDETPSVRASAAAALAEIRPVAPSIVPALMEALRDPDDGARTAVIAAIIRLGPEAKAALGIMIAISHRDSDALARQTSLKAIQAIGRGTKASVPGLIDNLKASEGDIRRESVIALCAAEITPEELTPILAIVLKDGDTTVKAPALQTATELVKTYPGAIHLLHIAALDVDKKIKPVAIEALGGAVSDPAAATLVLDEVIKDSDPAVRNQCIQSLARLGPAAVPVLLKALDDSYTVLGENAKQAILAMGANALPPLERAMATPDPAMQQKISELITKIDSSKHPTPPKPSPAKKRKK